MGRAATVRAVNRLAARWARLAEGGNTVFMPAGVWPLLAFLATGAHGPAVAELEDALGMRSAEAAGSGRELLAMLAALPGSSAAVGLWTSRAFDLNPAWRADLPAGAHEVLTGVETEDRRRLDAWAARNTDGLIDSMPVMLEPDTRLVLASALTVRTDWIRPFHESWYRAAEGPWAGGPFAFLSRRSALIDRVAVAQTPAGPVTELRVLGNNSIEVHLLLGEPDAAPAAVLDAGLGILDRSHPRVTADLLPVGRPGPGLSIEWIRTEVCEHSLWSVVPAFTIEADHDLLARPEAFGLTAAADSSVPGGHFGGITAGEPLFIGSGRQSATAAFGPEGFRAAAVTAFGAVGAGLPRLRYRAKAVGVRFDRPFGFLAVHRVSGLVLAAGWVAEPQAAARPEWLGDADDEDEDEYRG